jgi:hypothetical protein
MAHDPRDHLHKLLKRFDHAMLVARAPEGGLHARPMAVAHAGEKPRTGPDQHAKVKL